MKASTAPDTISNTVARNNLEWLRHHWFDLGLVLAPLAVGIATLGHWDALSLLLWLSLASLFLHQFEEYRWPGYFPGMMNTVMFASKAPDRYPLNTNSAWIINVGVGWTAYLAAALVGAHALWLAIATILVSVGNFFAHGLLFNIKGRTWYNPGFATAIFLFGPISVYFVYLITTKGLASPIDWIIGVALGVVLNYVGILKLVDWLKCEDTEYVFPRRCVQRGT